VSTKRKTHFTKVHCQELSGKNQDAKFFARNDGMALSAFRQAESQLPFRSCLRARRGSPSAWQLLRGGPFAGEKLLNRVSRHIGFAIPEDNFEFPVLSPAPCRRLRDAHDFNPFRQAHSTRKLHLGKSTVATVPPRATVRLAAMGSDANRPSVFNKARSLAAST
jgi:hypothetical protein